MSVSKIANKDTPTIETSFQNVPDELNIEIFKYLPELDLVRCGLVCKRWEHLSGDNLLWKELFKSRFPSPSHLGAASFKEAYEHQITSNRNLENGLCTSRALEKLTNFEKSYLADGMFFSSDKDNTIHIWDTEKCMYLPSLKGHTASPSCFTTAHGMLFSGSKDHTIRMWDPQNCKHTHTFEGHTKPITVLASAKGILFSGSDDDTIKMWNIEDGTCLRTLIGHTNSITSLAVADNGMLFSSGKDNKIRMWDVHTGTCVKIFDDKNLIWTHCVALADGKLFSSSLDGVIKIWDIEKASCLHTFNLPTPLLAITIADGKLFLPQANLEIGIWDIKKSSYLPISLRGHADSITSFAVDETGKKLFSSDFNSCTKLWDIEKGTCLQTFQRKERRSVIQLKFWNWKLISHLSEVTPVEIKDFASPYPSSYSPQVIEENLRILKTMANPDQNQEDLRNMAEKLHPDFGQRLEECRGLNEAPFSTKEILQLQAEVCVEALLHAIRNKNGRNVQEKLDQLHRICPGHMPLLYGFLSHACGKGPDMEWGERALRGEEGYNASIQIQVQAALNLKANLKAFPIFSLGLDKNFKYE